MATLSGRTWCVLLMMPLLYQLVSAEEDSTNSIGQGYYLPRRDLMSSFTGGATIFEGGVPDECIDTRGQKETRNDKTFYQNSGSFYQSMAVSSGLDVSLKGKFTMGFSLTSASVSISGSSYQVTGTSINVFTVKDDVAITQDCLNDLKLAKALEQDFEKLPLEISEPSEPRSWYKYKLFVEKYGSHVLNKLQRGSRMVQWTFAQSSKKYSENDFTIKGCMDLSKLPTKAGHLSVKSCGNYSKNEIQRISKLTMSSKLTLLGGTTKTRSKLARKRTQKLIAQFMEEADTDPNPIVYKFRSIWDVLKQRFVGTNEDNLIRAMNIEAYFSGIMDFGCTREKHGNVVLRGFVRTLSGNMPHYTCQIPNEGCRGDGDCHIGGVAFTCYCYGDGCVDSRPVTDPSSKIKEKRIIRRSSSGSYGEGVNDSCNYNFGVYCTCNKSWGRGAKTIWPTRARLLDEESLWDVHAKFLKRSRDWTCKRPESGDNPEEPKEEAQK